MNTHDYPNRPNMELIACLVRGGDGMGRDGMEHTISFFNSVFGYENLGQDPSHLGNIHGIYMS